MRDTSQLNREYAEQRKNSVRSTDRTALRSHEVLFLHFFSIIDVWKVLIALCDCVIQQ